MSLSDSSAWPSASVSVFLVKVDLEGVSCYIEHLQLVSELIKHATKTVHILRKFYVFHVKGMCFAF